ncbi:MAG: DivIVA domain-containing protein [Calditrichaeota bacterium]|nr:DivIVA domain-containing protein [Calditrichota bacterium]MCB9368713.1 DivIVA domain-containing protein [Calditrichota bacterium]
MSLSPVDIARHEFSKSLRGYDVGEVRGFLEGVASELAELQVKLTQAEEAAAGAQAQLKAFRDMEKNLRDAVVTAQQGMSDSREQLVRERETMLREAQLEADRILLEGERKLQELREQIREMQVQKDAYVTRLRYLHNSHGWVLEMMEKDPPADDTPQEKVDE